MVNQNSSSAELLPPLITWNSCSSDFIDLIHLEPVFTYSRSLFTTKLTKYAYRSPFKGWPMVVIFRIIAAFNFLIITGRLSNVAASPIF